MKFCEIMPGSRFVSMDPNVHPEHSISPALVAKLSPQVTFIDGFSPCDNPKACSAAQGKFDLVLIDANHYYEACLRDIQGVVPFLSDNAVILLHDAHFLGVKEAVRTALAKERGFVDCGLVSTAANYDLMYQAMVRETKGTFNQIVYWSRLPDWKNQTLTPNPDAIYLMPFLNTKEVGPVVLEIPSADEGSITGSIDDGWQAALEDVGPAGVDKGKGGKYLILPPGYAEKVPDGYIALPSDTYQTYALLRSILKSGSETDIAKAVAYGKRVKVYPLSQAASPPPTVFVDAIDVVFDSTIPYDLRFFESLDRFVQYEPWLERDKAMIDQLKSIGIQKGKLFDPDAKTQVILKAAASEAHRRQKQQRSEKPYLGMIEAAHDHFTSQ
jgi:hypothetical protein